MGVKQPPTFWSAQELPAASLTRHQVQGTKSRVVSWPGVSRGGRLPRKGPREGAAPSLSLSCLEERAIWPHPSFVLHKQKVPRRGRRTLVRGQDVGRRGHQARGCRRQGTAPEAGKPTAWLGDPPLLHSWTALDCPPLVAGTGEQPGA